MESAFHPPPSSFTNSKGNTMELSDKEAKAIKAIYSDYHAGATNAEETLHALEQLINGDND